MEIPPLSLVEVVAILLGFAEHVDHAGPSRFSQMIPASYLPLQPLFCTGARGGKYENWSSMWGASYLLWSYMPWSIHPLTFWWCCLNCASCPQMHLNYPKLLHPLGKRTKVHNGCKEIRDCLVFHVKHIDVARAACWWWIPHWSLTERVSTLG